LGEQGRDEGLPVPPAGRLKASASAAIVCLLIAVTGCGGAEGVEAGATVRAYVVQPLCAGAERQLQGAGGRAGDVRVEVVCLPSVESKGQLKLARVGANARRATEDSTAVAYLEAPGPGNEFSEPVLVSAEIPSIHDSSGTKAMAQLLRAIGAAQTTGSLRLSVASELKGS
jgi:hypothetical protein